MNVTKADILKALDWFDENYGDAIDDEDIEELCTWQNNYDKALPAHAYYMAFIYILNNFPQSEIEKHREKLGIPAYVTVSQKHGVKSIDFSDYSGNSGKLEDRNVAEMEYPSKISFDKLKFDGTQPDGIYTMEETAFFFQCDKAVDINEITIKQDPKLQLNMSGHGFYPQTLILNDYNGSNFSHFPMTTTALKLNGNNDLLESDFEGLEFGVLDLTGLTPEVIHLPAELQLKIATGLKAQIVRRKDQKIIVKKKFVEVLKPLVKII